MARQREQWSSKAHQYAAMAAVSMGLRSVLWCPYLMLRYGIAAFVTCYVIVVATIVYPVLYVESVLSQFTKSGNRGVFNCCPLFRGFSYSMAYFAVMVNLPQYSTVSHALYYVLRSVESTPPWASCSHEQSSPPDNITTCYAPSAGSTPCEAVATTLARRFSDKGVQDGYPLLHRGRVTIVPIEEFNNAFMHCIAGNESAVAGFYNQRVLGLGSGVGDICSLQVDTLLMTSIVLVVLCVLLRDGLVNMRYSLYGLVTLKYTLLVALFCATIFRPGAFHSIHQMFMAKLGNLAHVMMWQDVVAFAAFGVGLGGYGITLISAHNGFQNNFLWDLAYVLVVDTMTCLLTSALVFFVLGSYASKTGLEIDQILGTNVVEDVAFVHIPEALLATGASTPLMMAFFLLVTCMGLGCLVLTTELVVEVVDEEFPHAHVNQRIVRAVTTGICFFGSFIYITPAGPYIKVLILEYLYYVVGYINIIGELLVVFQFYGLQRVMLDCGLMLEIVPWRGLQILWTSIIPMLLTIFTVMGTLFRPSPTFRDYEYPPPAKIVAAAVAVAGLMFVPSYAYSILSANNFNLEVVKTHATRWRPADPKFAREYKKRLMSLGLLVRRHRQEDKPAGGAAASATSVVGAAAADIIVIEAEKSPTTVEGAATEDASAK